MTHGLTFDLKGWIGLEGMQNLRLCNPGNFGGEAFNMVLLALKNLCGNKHGEVTVLHANCLDIIIKPALNLLPDCI